MTVRWIRPRAPYSLARTVGAFGRFSDESVDILVPGGYRRLLDVDSHLILVDARQENLDDPTSRVKLTVLNAESLPSSAAEKGLNTVRRLLALDEPIDKVRQLINAEPRLAGLEPALHGLRRTLDPSPFEGLVSSILAQLISIRGASVVRARLVQRFGRSLHYEGRTYWSFPEPEALLESSIDELCGTIRMTSAKARSILAVAGAAVSGQLDRDRLDRMDDQELMDHLIALPGIGRWTAEWFMLNVMGRMSIVPAGDLGIRRSTGRWLLDGEMPTEQQVREVYEPFGDQRGYVAYYVLSGERYGVRPRS